mgnify:CR=1 FL=1
MNQDRNLLFGVFAVQLKRVSASEIMSAAAAWAAEPSQELSERLVANHALSTDDCAFLDRLVDEAIDALGGDASVALANLGDRAVVKEEGVRVMSKGLDAAFARANGDLNEALTLAQEAVEMEKTMTFQFGPPAIAIPSAELLGELLIESGEYERAAAAFSNQLTQTQGRSASLVGLAKASKGAGNKAAAEDAYQRLEKDWHASDSDISKELAAFR